MTTLIQIPFSQYPLGRHIRHDERNRNHPAPRRAVPVQDVRHRRRGSKLNQGSLGACTGFALAHCLNTEPLRSGLRRRKTMSEKDAIGFYSGGTKRDPWEGQYPPEDTGCSGQAVCEEAVALGYATGYVWAFGHEHGLESIQGGPLMQGTFWTHDMFEPEPGGRVRITGSDAGGHEYLWVGVEMRSRLSPSQNRDWFFNSWGAEWGEAGYFWMTWDDHAALLDRQGDLVRPVI